MQWPAAHDHGAAGIQGNDILRYRPDIDGLRSLAVLPVVFYHAGFPSPSGGFIGVDVFFVISGFLITSIVAREIAEDRFSLVGFYERRARRILPALMLVILACFVVGWFVLMPGEFRDLGRSALATALFVSNIYFLLTLDYFSPSAEFAPLLHTWSLAVEEQFYLFFPPLLMLLAWRGWRRPAWIVACLSLISFAASVYMLPRQPEAVFYVILYRAWELGLGALLALVALQPPAQRLLREMLAFAGLAAILIPVFLYRSSMPFPGAAAAPPVIGAAMLIWLGARSGGSLVNTLLAHRALVWIGLISYSLYLWHWPILVFVRVLLDTAEIPLPIATLAVGASVLMAWLSYRLVERPFRQAPPNGLARGAIFAWSAAAMTAVIAAGTFLHVSRGLPSRLPADVNALAAYVDDGNPRRRECLDRAPDKGLCRIGRPAADGERLDFLLWGDSHAEAIMPGVDRAARLAGKHGAFAGRSVCPPILGIQRDTNGEACAAFNASVWSWLNERPDIDVVVLAARWTYSVEGGPPKGEAGAKIQLEWIGDSARKPAASDNASLVQAGLLATVEAIAATGRSVVLLGPVPEPARNVPYAMARKALLGWTPGVSLASAQHEARSGRTEQILAQLARDNPSVRYIPLADLFCSQDQCRLQAADGALLYRDDDHISQTAAIQHVPPRLMAIWRE